MQIQAPAPKAGVLFGTAEPTRAMGCGLSPNLSNTSMPVQILSHDAHILNMRARLPFRFGIITMTFAPHLFLRVELAIDGQRAQGFAADHLPPKWFTKNPKTAYADDVAEMIR